MKLSASANCLNKKDLHLDLHNFKMNISKTLGSNFLKKFNDLTNQDLKTNKIKVRTRLSTIPTIPVKVTNSYISINPNANTPDFDLDNHPKKNSLPNEFIQSKCQSPFLLRRSIQSQESIEIGQKLDHEDKYSNISSNVSTLRMKDLNQSDSGLSSLNSAQLFFAEVKEVFSKTKRNGSVKSNLNSSSITSKKFNSLFRNLLSKNSNTDKYLSSPSLLSISKLDDAAKMQNSLIENANLGALEYLLQLKREDNIPIHQIIDQDGNNLLHKAIIYNQYDIVRYLIQNHSILVNCKNNFDLYPIHLCVLKGDMPILRLVSRESKKHVNKRDASDMTPAMHAAIEGKYEALKYLLDNANAKYNKVTKKERFTLLHLGAQSGSLDVVQYLLFKMGMPYLKCRTKDGATVYHIAAARGHDQILEYLLAIKSSKYVKNLKDITGSTPAHDAAENGHYKCLKLLYDAGLDMYEEDTENMTPYELALTSKSIECKNFVLECLKPVKSMEDDKDLRNPSSNNASSQASSYNKKINLRRIGSMLRLRRAKDINHEPAYLYRQKFRPAPVSLPEQSKISGFKNEPVSQPENEDELNDSVIDELINHVQNNSIKRPEKTLMTTISPGPESIEYAYENELEEKIVTNRASRYEQHHELKNYEIKRDNSIEQKEKTNSPPKKSETSNLGIILKNSLSSSRETTPTIIRLSRSGTPTPLLQSVARNEAENNELNGTKLGLLVQKRMSYKENSLSPGSHDLKNLLIKDNTEIINRRYSLSNEKRIEENKIKRQSLNNYNKLSSLDFSFSRPIQDESQLYEPDPDYWDVPYNNNMEHLSRADITDNKLESSQVGVSLAQVILKSVRESVKKNEKLNEEIIISETVRIVSDHNEVKNMQAPNEQKLDYVYNTIEDGEKLSQFKTSIKANDGGLDEQTASFVSGFEDFPQPPSQSFLKLTQMDYSVCISSPSPGDSSNLPPPPPPPPLPTSSVPSTPPALTLNLNSETLLLAKNKLKIKSSEEHVDPKPKDSKTKLTENKEMKKNVFLLQEIQNHRLYNTKKDYVLEYLDRNTNLVPSVSYSPSSSGSTICKIQGINRSLSNANLSKTDEEENKSVQTQSPVSSTVTTTTTTSTSLETNQPMSSYERFPYLKNKIQNNYNKFGGIYPCGSYLSAKRTQSSNPLNRQPLSANQPVINSRSFSVERPIRIDEIENKPVTETKNNNCVIIVNKSSPEVKKTESIKVVKNENSQESSLINAKKFRQLIPQEKLESELDRVFRKRALQSAS